jgi:hypothetical protein
MRKWSRYRAGVIAITGLLALGVHAGAETCKLEMKRFVTPVRNVSGVPPRDYRFRMTGPQSFFMQIGGPQGMVSGSGRTSAPEFAKVIKKEPAKYVAKHPFRGVAKLGSDYFGFVFDAAPEEEAKEKGAQAEADATGMLARAKQWLVGGKKMMKVVSYERLYFDANHNGDLTDDKVIEAQSTQRYSTSYITCSFPSVDVKIEVNGTKLSYAFTLRVYSNASTNFSYANASLNAAAYREGEMVIDGKKRRIVVVDFNSNGRFDDPTTVDSNTRLADGTVYPTQGDMLYIIDPEMKASASSNPYDPSANSDQHFVGKLVNVDGRFYDLKVSPSGVSLALNPSTSPTGYVTNPNKGYRAIVYGEQGFLKVVSDETGKAPMPVGEWQLASYTIYKDESAEPEKGAAEQESLLGAIASALTDSARISGPRITLVSARAKRDYPAVRVTQDKTVELPFGEPYRAVVVAQYPQAKRTVSLGLSLVGNAGEICSSMLVNGRQPGKPEFTITTEKGEVVDSGSFEYG